MKELFNNPKEEEYLSEFKQKIAQEMQEDIERRRHELEHSRNSFIGAVAGVILAFVVSWFLFLPHFGFNDSKEIPVIRRPMLPVKIQPNDPGGMEIQNQDKTVYALVEKNEAEDTKVESLLPEPEQPKMPVIVAETVEILDTNALETQTMDELINAVETTATERVKIPAKLPVIDVDVKKTNEPLSVKKEEPLQTAQAKKEEPKAKVAQEIVKSEVQKTEVVAEQKTEPKVVVNTVEQAEPVASGSWCVQLMASNNKDATQKGYETLKKQYPVIKGVKYRVEGGNDGMWRLKIGGYATKAEADDLCFKIKSAGGNCMVKDK